VLLEKGTDPFNLNGSVHYYSVPISAFRSFFLFVHKLNLYRALLVIGVNFNQPG
jgi:hypothetical protein